jgi:phage terminase large subunit
MPAPNWFDFKNPDYDRVYQTRMTYLTNIRKDRRSILPGLKAFYKDNPTQFLMDWGQTFDPRLAEIGRPTVVPFILWPRQEEFVEWVVQRWRNREDGLAEKSRDMGVSWLCVGVAVWMWLFYPGTVIGFGSRKEEYIDKLSDPKSLFWKARQLIDALPIEFRPVGWDSRKHAPHMRIINPENRSCIIGEAGDNIGRGARTSLYFKDESAFLERPETVDAALSQTSNCKLDISTPNGNGNPFYRKRHGGKIPVFTFHWRDDPRKDDTWYKRQTDTLDPVIVAQEIEIDYDASVTNSFIPGDTVIAAMNRGPADIAGHGGLRVGVDVARFGDDASVITFRRGRHLIKQISRHKLSVVQCAGLVRAEVQAFNEPPEQIAVDSIGIGAGVADILRGWYGKGVVVDVNSAIRFSDGKNYNLRSFMWSEMRDWFESEVCIPNDPELKAQLCALQYEYRAGELLIESKEVAKARGISSPDRADSLALTFAYPSKAKLSRPQPVTAFSILDEAVGY